MAVLLDYVWHSAMVKSGSVSSRILWIKFKFSRVKVCVVVGYGPKGDDERFCNDMDRTLDTVGSGYRLCLLGDPTGWIGDRTTAGNNWCFRSS